MILGEGAVKMSKSKGNVINPDVIVKQYGADALRLYEMFMGPFEQMIPWDEKGLVGCRRFIEKIYNLVTKKGITNKTNEVLKKLLHRTIKKVSEDIELMKFNTAVSSMMEFVNAWQISADGLDRKDLSDFLIILSPFSPHLAEELWTAVGFSAKGGSASGGKAAAASAKAEQKSVEKPAAPQVAPPADSIAYRILVRPIVSEKTARLEKEHQYAFVVAARANKVEIKKAVEKHYRVHVTNVNIVNVFGKYVRSGRVLGKRSDWRKAYVTVKEGESITY